MSRMSTAVMLASSRYLSEPHGEPCRALSAMLRGADAKQDERRGSRWGFRGLVALL